MTWAFVVLRVANGQSGFVTSMVNVPPVVWVVTVMTTP
jgi:hypothetical protein